MCSERARRRWTWGHLIRRENWAFRKARGMCLPEPLTKLAEAALLGGDRRQYKQYGKVTQQRSGGFVNSSYLHAGGWIEFGGGLQKWSGSKILLCMTTRLC